ncbi:MAG: hypothetical protein LBU37_12580 [Tannerellaceae bacterium]|jgi:hypothetical protein|nr:hypothetical protein [Tannerellaceae bacterium]
MKPIEFKECNAVYGQDQPEYMRLPAVKIDSLEGEVISCWELSLVEKIRVLFTGKIWIGQMSFNRPISPILPSTRKSDLFIVKEP